jgi:hypothetical protein
VIHIRTVWRKGFSVLFFENLGIFSIFERNRGRDIGLCDGINLRGGRTKCDIDGGFELGDINNREGEELVLGMDLPRGQNNRKATTTSGGRFG